MRLLARRLLYAYVPPSTPTPILASLPTLSELTDLDVRLADGLSAARNQMTAAEEVLHGIKTRGLNVDEGLQLAVILRRASLCQIEGDFTTEMSLLKQQVQNHHQTGLIDVGIAVANAQDGSIDQEQFLNTLQNLPIDCSGIQLVLAGDEESLNQASQLYEDRGKVFQQSLALILLGKKQLRLDRPAEAMESVSRALKLFSATDDDPLLNIRRAICLSEAARFYHVAGDGILSEGLFRKSLSLFRQHSINVRPVWAVLFLEYADAVRGYAKLLNGMEFNNRSRAAEADRLLYDLEESAKKHVPVLLTHNPKLERRVPLWMLEDLFVQE